MTTSSTSPKVGKKGKRAWAIVAGVAIGAGLGVGAHALAPAPLGSEAPESLFDAPHPTPSPSNVGLLAELNWRQPPAAIPEIVGWNPDADPGWPGVALDAGDLWALESACDEDGTALYLVSPGGRRLELMALRGCATVWGWDHDAGLAYANGSEGPIVIDLATYQWAAIPLLPEWTDGAEYGVNVYPSSTTTSGEVIWRISGAGAWMGTWDPIDGWDVFSISANGWDVGPGVPSDWVAEVDYESDSVTIINVVTHENVVLPGTLETWNTGEMELNLTWLDGDTIARPPSGSEGWMAFDAPAFDAGRPMGIGDFPLNSQEEFSTAQFPGTPLVAVFTSNPRYWERTVASLGVITTDGYREIVDLTDPGAAPLYVWNAPFEARPGVYVFARYDSAPLVVDVVAGKAYTYGVTADYPADAGAYVNVTRVVYVAPKDGDADAD